MALVFAVMVDLDLGDLEEVLLPDLWSSPSRIEAKLPEMIRRIHRGTITRMLYILSRILAKWSRIYSL